MALFQRKPQLGSSLPLYRLGLQKTLLIIGLGNPGKEYDGTRHNIGFACLDHFAKKLEFPDWIVKKNLHSQISQLTVSDSRVILMKPTTFMNLSGKAAGAVQHFYKVPISQIIVVHDELDVDFGQIRNRVGGGAAGHNGVKSLIEHLGEGFGRIRIGINNKSANEMDSTDFVLSKFSKEEQAQIDMLLRETTSILSEFAHGQPLLTETRSFII